MRHRAAAPPSLTQTAAVRLCVSALPPFRSCASLGWPQIELYSPTYFAACGVGGILSCGLTHGLMTPLDLVKCNAQTNPKEFPGAIAGIRAIYSGKVTHLGFGSGVSGLAKGWAPTFIGYGLQGLCKFGFYEYFKHLYGGQFSAEDAAKYKDLIWVCASASAEFIADVALCPFEAVKVRYIHTHTRITCSDSRCSGGGATGACCCGALDQPMECAALAA